MLNKYHIWKQHLQLATHRDISSILSHSFQLELCGACAACNYNAHNIEQFQYYNNIRIHPIPPQEIHCTLVLYS